MRNEALFWIAFFIWVLASFKFSVVPENKSINQELNG